MRILLDTNILLDIALQRPGFFADSSCVVQRADQLGFVMVVAWHGLATVFYLAERQHGSALAVQVVRDILSWATVATAGHPHALRALTFSMPDFEDALQVASAEAEGVSLIVTRNAKDFTTSPVPVVSPAEFLTRHGRP